MCKSNFIKAFFSLDASIAFLSTLIIFLTFLQLLYFASESFSYYSNSVSYTLLSIRISYVLLDSLYEGKTDFDLRPIRDAFGLSSVKASLAFEDETMMDWVAGNDGKQAYCTKRLAFLSGKIALLTVCVS
ncbi:MAG: hypothetical protein QXN37_02340 [Candidatus Anstonellaceae archaeon]